MDNMPNSIKYKKINEHMPNPCTHTLLVGSTGSGKTNMLLNMLKYMYFDDLYLFCKDLSEDKYELLKSSIAALESQVNEGLRQAKKQPIKIGHYSESLKDIPDINTLDKHKQYVFIFDDFLTDSKKDQGPIEQYFVRSRKRGVNCFYLSQNLFDIPKIIQKNASYVVLYDNGNAREVQEYAKSYASKIPYDDFVKIYHQIMQSDHSYLIIDTAERRDIKKHLRSAWDNYDLMTNYLNSKKHDEMYKRQKPKKLSRFELEQSSSEDE